MVCEAVRSQCIALTANISKHANSDNILLMLIFSKYHARALAC